MYVNMPINAHVVLFNQPTLYFMVCFTSLNKSSFVALYVAKSSFYTGIKAIHKIETAPLVIPLDLQAGLFTRDWTVWEKSVFQQPPLPPEGGGFLSLPVSLSLSFYTHFIPVLYLLVFSPQSQTNPWPGCPYNQCWILTWGPQDESCNYRLWQFLAMKMTAGVISASHCSQQLCHRGH